jgi:tetratricopeptide (TPR) repeat protein
MAIDSALDLDPEFELAPRALAEIYAQNSRFNGAVKILQNSSTPTEDEARLAVLGSIYGLSGQPERAREILRQLLEVNRHQPISGYYLAQVYLSLGDTAAALSSLERAAEERSPLIPYVNVAPEFAKLRGEPRFHAAPQENGTRTIASQ